MKLLYSLLGAMLGGMARLPFRALYALSDVIFFLLYYVVRYRRRVVLDNIVASFPDMSASECRATARQCFRNFADYFVETVKLAHISDEEMMRRMEFENVATVDRILSSGRSIVVYFAHCFNWEWAPSITLWSDLKPGRDAVFSQVYRPLVNKWFDSYFLKLRGRFHSESYPKRTVLRDLIKERRAGMPGICGFMSDQKPSHGDVAHVVNLLNHPTAMITGTEQVARKLDSAVMYMDMYKLRRGHYRIVMRLITETPSRLPEMAITERYASLLQQTIRRNPSIWLWSHKRWKIPVTFPDNESKD